MCMFETLLPQEKWILLGIPILFLVGSIFHYLYQISGKAPFVAFLAPINESVWEHTKMVVLPLILWWSLFYLNQKEQLSLDADAWFSALLVSLLVSILSIPFLYYFYTEAFGVSLLWVDILILLLALALGQLLGLFVLRHPFGLDSKQAIGMILLILVFYCIATLHPPKYPMFQSKVES